MEYAAGVKKAQYNKVKLENRKMLIKPSYLITAVGIAFCVAFTVYGMQKGLFTSQEAMEQFLKPFPAFFQRFRLRRKILRLLFCLGYDIHGLGNF